MKIMEEEAAVRLRRELAAKEEQVFETVPNTQSRKLS